MGLVQAGPGREYLLQDPEEDAAVRFHAGIGGLDLEWENFKVMTRAYALISLSFNGDINGYWHTCIY